MAAPTARLRNALSMPGLIQSLHRVFSQIPDTRRSASCRYTLTDALGAAFAMFSLKLPSMLQFDQAAHADPRLIHNLKHLFQIDRVPPEALRPAFERLHAELAARQGAGTLQSTRRSATPISRGNGRARGFWRSRFPSTPGFPRE